VCCSVLQSVAVCCRVLQCVAVCCSVLQCVAVCCAWTITYVNLYTQKHTKNTCTYNYVHASQWQCGALRILLQCVAVRCSALQCVAVHCIDHKIYTRICTYTLTCKPIYVQIASRHPYILGGVVGHINIHTPTQACTLTFIPIGV